MFKYFKSISNSPLKIVSSGRMVVRNLNGITLHWAQALDAADIAWSILRIFVFYMFGALDQMKEFPRRWIHECSVHFECSVSV